MNINARTAILYIRVSTDEQADKGYSLKHQEERLNKYCEMNNITVVAIYQDDYSAKTFHRPEFTKLLNVLRKHRGKADLLLFTKWDRFSRNTGDAYGIINTLNKLGVDPQAIEQPLDLSIPENKIMLAFYLAAPEVENEELSKGVFHVDEIRRECNKLGLKCSRNNFWHLLKNPVYCGKIHVPAYKDDDECIVQGSHQAIISEELFERVHDVLTGRRRKHAYKVCAKEELPLRGFLNCPRCGKKLTGSASTGGSGGKHFYYHCTKDCKERVKAYEINDSFSNYLKTLTFTEEVEELYDLIVKEVFRANSEEKPVSQKQIQEEIQKNRERINNAQQMMLDAEITPNDFKEIKKRYEPIIDALVRQQMENNQSNSELKRYLKNGLTVIKNLDKIYDSAPLAKKQQIIRSICKENLQFSENKVRTVKLNELVSLIAAITKGSNQKQNGIDKKKSHQSHMVIPLGLILFLPFSLICFTPQQ